MFTFVPISNRVPATKKPSLSEENEGFRGVNQNRTGDRGVADLCLTAWLWRHIQMTPTGFEPMLSPWKGGVLTSWPRGQTSRKRKTPRVGLEPTTLRLTAECSTIELSRNNKSTNFYDYSGIRKELQSLFTETSASLLFLSVPSKPHTKSFIQTSSVPLNRYQG